LILAGRQEGSGATPGCDYAAGIQYVFSMDELVRYAKFRDVLAEEMRRQGTLQRPSALRRQEIHLHMITHQSLKRRPPGLNTKPLPDLFSYDYLALRSYYIRHSTTSLILL